MSDEVSCGNAVFLQPGKVGSSVRYSVGVFGTGKSSYCEAAVYLTDCDRKISWHGEAEDLVVKIDAAMKILLEARSKITAGIAEVKKRKKIK